MNNDDLEFYRDEITRSVMDQFSPIIHKIEWDEEKQMWKVNLDLYDREDDYVWVSTGGDVYFETDFDDEFDSDDFFEDIKESLDMDLEV